MYTLISSNVNKYSHAIYSADTNAVNAAAAPCDMPRRSLPHESAQYMGEPNGVMPYSLAPLQITIKTAADSSRAVCTFFIPTRYNIFAVPFNAEFCPDATDIDRLPITHSLTDGFDATPIHNNTITVTTE